MNSSNLLYQNGRRFEKEMDITKRKNKGVYYTPPEMVNYITSKALENIDIVQNPYLKILDPSCGAGYFLIKAMEILEEKFSDKLDELLKNNKELRGRLNKNNIRSFIAENIIYGADIDIFAVELAKNNIISWVGESCKTNIIFCDSLISGYQQNIMDFAQAEEIHEFWNKKYDYILGNPPYIGHKTVDNDYKKVLQTIYKGIYKDKSDILYCFIKRSIDILESNGRISFICSRYFLEGPSADGLRNFIVDNCYIDEIYDFQGCRVFEDADVASCILTIVKDNSRNNKTLVKKFIGENKKGAYIDVSDNSSCNTFYISNDMLKGEGWLLLSPEQYDVFRTIEAQSKYEVGELFESYQGIITGCDKAFIVNTEEIEAYMLERELLKPWIKNKNVQRNYIIPPNQYIIYADLIDDMEKYPNSIKHIGRYREKLEGRRECQKGIREWYKLQWGRKSKAFKSKKIVYPFKASSNRFALDDKGMHCSADVYSLILKEGLEDEFSYEFSVAFLNSSISEFYFKCFAKKLSANLYDYYPNTVLRIKVPDVSNNVQLHSLSRELAYCKNEDEENCIAAAFNRELYKIYSLNDKQIDIIENYIRNSRIVW